MKQFSIRAYARIRSISLVLLACLTLQLSSSVVYAMQSQPAESRSGSNWVHGLSVVIGKVTRPTGKVLQKIVNAIDEKSPNIVEIIADSKVVNWVWHDVLGLKNSEEVSDRDEIKHMITSYGLNERYRHELKCPQNFAQGLVFALLVFSLIPAVQAVSSDDVNPQKYNVCHELSDNIVLCSRLQHIQMCIDENALCYGVLNPALPKEGYKLSTQSLCTTIPASSGSVSFCLFEKNNPQGPLVCLSTHELDGVPSSDYTVSDDYQFIDSALLKKLYEKAEAQKQKEIDEANLKLAQMESNKCDGPLCHLVVLAGQTIHVVGNTVDAVGGLVHRAGNLIDKEEKVTATPTLTPTPTPTLKSTSIPSYELVQEIQKFVQNGTCLVHVCTVEIPLFAERVDELSQKLQVKKADTINFSSIPALCNLIMQKSDDLLKFNDWTIEGFIAVVIAYEKQNTLYDKTISAKNTYTAEKKTDASPIIKQVNVSVQDVIINSIISQYHDPKFKSELGAITFEREVKSFGGWKTDIEKTVIYQCHLISKNNHLKLTITPEGISKLDAINMHRIVDMLAGIATGRPEALAQGYALLEGIGNKSSPVAISSKRTLADSTNKRITNPSTPALEITPDSSDRISYLLELGEQQKGVTSKLLRAYEAITQTDDDSDDS